MKSLIKDLFFSLVAPIVVTFLCAVVAFILLPSPSHAQTSTGYNGGAQQQSSVVFAEVLMVREVVLTGQPSQTGQLIGQTVGGALGALVGAKSNSYAITGVATTIGSVAGGYVGGSHGSAQDSQEIIVKYENGSLAAITQSVKDGVKFAKGQRVMVIGQGRVAPVL